MTATEQQVQSWDWMLTATVGSTAYGLATEHSDVDTLGVAMAPLDTFLGLRPPVERDLTYVGTDPDVTVHEVGKFLRLCLGVNPTVTDLLWVPEELHSYRAPAGEELIGLREHLLSAPRVLSSYFGYAWQQFERLSSKGTFANVPHARIAKHARHLMRLVIQGEQFYRTGRVDVRLADPQAVREFGERVAADVATGAELAREFVVSRRASLVGVVSPLPPEPDVARVQEWLIELRHR